MTSKTKTTYIRAITLALILTLIVTVIASANPDFSVEVADRYGYERQDLNDGAVVEYIGDYNVSYGSSGSGVFNPFVRLQGNEKKTDFESGYNTDAKKPEFDTKTGVWTHAILLSEIPIIEFEGTLFWEFWADINDSDSTPLISLDDFELYLTDDPELLGYPFAPADATKIYDFDDANAGEFILINDVNQGSGRGDLRYLVPADDSAAENCNYGNPACTTYIVLYSEWGGKGDPYGFDGGFEEWKVKIYPKLQVSKDIYGSFETPVSWEITKDFDGTYNGFAGDSWTHGYEVSVTPSFGAPENTMVYGTITIIGDEDTAVDATITDKFNGADATITGCSVAENVDGTFTIAAGATVTCSYELGLDAPVDGTNVARASFEVDGVKLAFEGSASILEGAFVKTLTGYPDIDVVDTNGEAWSTTDGVGATWTYTRDFACPTDASLYVNGFYTFDIDNTATITQTGQSDDATVTIDCELQPLVPSKLAAGTWQRDVYWELEKTVDPASHSGHAGDSFVSTWTVVATKVDSGPYGYLVEGTIRIDNPAAIDQDFTLSDVLNDAAATPATVNCGGATTVPAGGFVDCTYTASPGDATATLNTVTVSAAGNPDQQASDPIEWSEILTGDDTVTVDDDRNPSGFPASISGTTTFTYDETFDCSSVQADYTNGFDSDTYPNLATLDGPNTDLEDDAEVVVNCELQPLVPSKLAAGTWQRDVYWELEKTVDPASHSGHAGDSFVSTWTVVATKVDSGPYGYLVEGTIHINNPAAIDQDFTLSDVLNDAATTPATVNCGGVSTVPAGGSVDCTYTASPGDATATMNTVTVSAVGNPDQQASDPIEWSEILTGDDTVTVDDDRNPSGFPASISGTTTFTYDETFYCSSVQADYTNGSDSDTYPNLATLDGPNTDLEDDAEVVVNCELQPLVPTKTAAGTWMRDVDWTLEKSVEPAYHSGLFGESFVSTWTVIATKIDSGPYGYLVEGTIHINNPAAIDQDFTLSDVLNDAATTPATVNCGGVSTVPAGGSVDCTYTASPGDATATMNTVTVSAVGNPDQQASDPIEWTEILNGIDEGPLTDPRFVFNQWIEGSATATFEETFTCSTNINDYVNGFYSFDVLNEAFLGGGIDLSASATVTVDCTLQIEYETAYAYDPATATCFSEFGESRWGWVNGPILPGEYIWPVYAGAGGCDPNDGTYVGDVTVTYDGTDVFVEWNLLYPNVLDAEHIYAGYADHPDSFAPGQLEIQSPFDGSEIYVIVHGVVGIPQIP